MFPVKYEEKRIESGLAVFSQSNARINPSDTYRLESIDVGRVTTIWPIRNPIFVSDAKTTTPTSSSRRPNRLVRRKPWRAIQNTATEAAIESGNWSPSTNRRWMLIGRYNKMD